MIQIILIELNVELKLLFDIYESGGFGSCGGFRYGLDDGNLWLTFEIEEANTADL